jgi:transposase
MSKQGQARHSPEVRERAIRMVREHREEYGSEWAAISSIAGKIGCKAETLRLWIRQAERDEGKRSGPTSSEQARIRDLEREVRELRQANEILRKASAYFAQAPFGACKHAPVGQGELDRRFKP